MCLNWPQMYGDNLQFKRPERSLTRLLRQNTSWRVVTGSLLERSGRISSMSEVVAFIRIFPRWEGYQSSMRAVA